MGVIAMLNLVHISKYTSYNYCLDNFTISFDMVTHRIRVHSDRDFNISTGIFNDVVVYEYNENGCHLNVEDILYGFKDKQHACSDIIDMFRNGNNVQESWDDICQNIIKNTKVYHGITLDTFLSNHMLTPLIYVNCDSFSVVGDFIDYTVTINDDYERLNYIADCVFDDLYDQYAVEYDRDDIMEEILEEYKRMYREINGKELPKEFFQ